MDASVARLDIFLENYGFAKSDILNFINRTGRMKENLAASWRCYTHDGIFNTCQTALGPKLKITSGASFLMYNILTACLSSAVERIFSPR